jgi:Holliday junction resolvase RusA-like endonuclease
MIQIFEVPVPPSANQITRHDSRSRGKGHHHENRKYTRWKRSLSWALGWQNVEPQPVPCRVSLVIVGGRGWRVNADIDNRLKPLLDGLQQCGILADDDTRHIEQEELIYIPRRPRQRAAVRCYVKLSPPEPSWFDRWQMPAESILDGGKQS